MRRRDSFSLLTSFLVGGGFSKQGFSREARRPPQRIVDAWPAHTALLSLLGAQNKIIAHGVRQQDVPWLFHLCPMMRHRPIVRAESLNREQLLLWNTDILFLPSADAGLSRDLDVPGMSIIPMGFVDFHGLLECVRETAEWVQTDVAARQSTAYHRDLSLLIDNPPRAHHRPSVVHVSSLFPLKIDGQKTIIDQWIHYAGGRNAASITGNHVEITVEQLLVWDPEIIILSANAGAIENITRHPMLSLLQAVKTEQVYRNPSGLFLWDRYGPELMLQIVWAQQIIASGTVKHREMRQRIQDFYQRFYTLSLSQEEAERILCALPPLAR